MPTTLNYKDHFWWFNNCEVFLTLQLLRVTMVWFLFVATLPTESIMKVIRIKKIIKTKEAHNCHTNSPCQCLKKIQGAVWRKYILMWGCKELRHQRVTKRTSVKFWDFAVIHLPQLSTQFCRSRPFKYNFTALISPAVSLEFCHQELKL